MDYDEYHEKFIYEYMIKHKLIDSNISQEDSFHISRVEKKIGDQNTPRRQAKRAWHNYGEQEWYDYRLELRQERLNLE